MTLNGNGSIQGFALIQAFLYLFCWTPFVAGWYMIMKFSSTSKPCLARWLCSNKAYQKMIHSFIYQLWNATNNTSNKGLHICIERNIHHILIIYAKRRARLSFSISTYWLLPVHTKQNIFFAFIVIGSNKYWYTFYNSSRLLKSLWIRGGSIRTKFVLWILILRAFKFYNFIHYTIKRPINQLQRSSLNF